MKFYRTLFKFVSLLFAFILLSGFSQMRRAIVSDDIEQVRALLEKGETPDSHDLILAIRRNNPQLVQLLLEKGANVKNECYLLVASDQGNADVVKALLSTGAKVDCTNRLDVTPLLWAARNGNTEAACLLVDHGADLNYQDICGNSVLIAAILSGNLEIVKVLLERGADVNLVTDNNDDELTALMWAVEKGNVDATRLLIEHGADINAKDAAGCTSLVRANRGNKSEIVEMLIAAGADRNQKCKE